jgi:alkanesulfonate monooxygenase SsuD/methylene tetrahydromethanopterin reductase-like flavin-dependent oxidoreductase (luciferase family)
VVRLGKEIEEAGLDHVWLANIFSFDAITTLALIGRETSRLRVGTAVTPTYPRHPGALAQQAMTTAAATDNRFTLGIGLSHQVVIENMFGMSYDKPAKHMREYLSVLMPLLRGETASFQGDQYSVQGLDAGHSRWHRCTRGGSRTRAGHDQTHCRNGGWHQYVDGGP